MTTITPQSLALAYALDATLFPADHDEFDLTDPDDIALDIADACHNCHESIDRIAATLNADSDDDSTLDATIRDMRFDAAIIAIAILAAIA